MHQKFSNPINPMEVKQSGAFSRTRQGSKNLAPLIALGLLALAAPVDAGTLYASSAAGGPGELYILDPLSGSVLHDIGPLNDETDYNYGITGLAFDPASGKLYGSTANSDPVVAAMLVTIDIATARVTVVGPFNAGNTGSKPATMADLSFNPVSGKLYGIASVGGPQLYSINLASGQATVVGSSGIASTTGGGLAVSAAGVFYAEPTSTRFGTYNPTTGAYSNIASPGHPVGGAYAALAFDEHGVLFGIDLGADLPPSAELVTINPLTAAVTDIGASLPSIDAIAFQPVIPPPTLVNAKILGNAFQFSFSGAPGGSYTVLSTTNLTLPSASWNVEGAPTAVGSGQFQFTSTPTANDPKRFYQVRTP